jgi:hypothetical protein
MWNKLSLNFVYFIFVLHPLNLNLTSNFNCGVQIQIDALKYFNYGGRMMQIHSENAEIGEKRI